MEPRVERPAGQKPFTTKNAGRATRGPKERSGMPYRYWAGIVLLVGLAASVHAQAPPQKAKGKGADAEYVERLLAARKEYQLTLEKLRAHYMEVGDYERA